MARPAAYYDERPAGGPSPWIPATILGIILLVATTPYRTAPDVAMAYDPRRQAMTTSFGGLPPALIWIPVIIFLLVQFFGGSYRSWYYRPRVAYGDVATVYPGVGEAYNDVNYNARYNFGSFMDFGGHWLLILLGIWLFTLVGPGSAPASRWGFPWSLFAPRQPQIVMPVI